jgi:hypothetical protein
LAGGFGAFPRPRRRAVLGTAYFGFAAADRNLGYRRPRDDDCRFWPTHLGRAERCSPAVARWPDTAVDGRGYARLFRRLSVGCSLIPLDCFLTGAVRLAELPSALQRQRRPASPEQNLRRHPRRWFRWGEHGHEPGERISRRSKRRIPLVSETNALYPDATSGGAARADTYFRLCAQFHAAPRVMRAPSVSISRTVAAGCPSARRRCHTIILLSHWLLSVCHGRWHCQARARVQNAG